MSKIVVPMIESYDPSTDSFGNLKREIDSFLKSEHKHKQPMFVFFQYTWLMHSEKYVDLKYIISYMKHEICIPNGWIFEDTFRIIIQTHPAAWEFADQINDLHGFECVLPMEYFIARSYVYESFKPEPHWNSQSEKCLMLFGKMSRRYRCDVFKQLADNDLLTEDKALWSLQFKHFSPVLQKRVVDNIDYEKYLSYERHVDDEQYKKYGMAGMLGYPYEEKFYTETSSSVIFETYAEHQQDSHTYLTEKTWRAISNKHPFLLLTSNRVMQHLEDMGFHTFTDYYVPAGKDYQLNGVVNHFAEYYQNFRSHIKNNVAEVQSQVEHNYRLYQEIGRDCVDQLPFNLSDPGFVPRPQPGYNITAARSLIDLECVVHSRNEDLEDLGILAMYDNIFSKLQQNQ